MARLRLARLLARLLPAGRSLSEAEVNRLLGAVHPDFATTRRLLLDCGWSRAGPATTTSGSTKAEQQPTDGGSAQPADRPGPDHDRAALPTAGGGAAAAILPAKGRYFPRGTWSLTSS